MNLPVELLFVVSTGSLADFWSRRAQDCLDPRCRILLGAAKLTGRPRPFAWKVLMPLVGCFAVATGSQHNQPGIAIESSAR